MRAEVWLADGYRTESCAPAVGPGFLSKVSLVITRRGQQERAG